MVHARRSVVALAVLAMCLQILTGAKPAAASGTGVVVSVGGMSIAEGDSGVRTAVFTVSLSRPSTTTVDLTYNVFKTTATPGPCTTAGADFVDNGAQFMTLHFPLLSTGVTAVTKTIAVGVCPDTVVEPDETFGVHLWGVTAPAAIGTSTGTGVILDDDASAPPGLRVSIGDATLVEGDAGTRSLTLPVTLSQPSAVPVTVWYGVTTATATCSATSGGVPTNPYADCAATPAAGKQISIPAGIVQKTIRVATFPDDAYEPDETFSVTLWSAGGATIDRGSATGIVTNDDTECGSGHTAPASYQHVVVFAFENRTWTQAGGPGFSAAAMPYLHHLAQRCSWYTTWNEADPTQDSMPQYVAQMTGAVQAGTIGNCAPAVTCSTTADNLFRQARAAGKTAINYVDGATQPCAAGSLGGPESIAWVQTVPALYMWDPADRAACTTQVRPYSEFDPNQLPDFAFVTPTPCHNGHQIFTCGTNQAVDTWATANVEPVLRSEAYRRGQVAVFVWYDEDTPVANLQIAPTAINGPFGTSGIGYASTLSAWESMLGFPCLANACSAADMRSISGI